LYEYDCPKCGRFERIQKFSDPILTDCPTCGSGVEKLLSAPAIQFKGTGWYVTDYAGKGKDPEAGKKTESKKDSSESSKKAESSKKPEKSSGSSKPAAASASK
jgi:putative FmdB family regulatory protein